MTTVSLGLTLDIIGPTLQRRFEAKCAPMNENGCILWIGTKNNKGYGMIGVEKMAGRKHRMAYAHRIAWALVNGAIPAGKVILHSCDNPLCVNPKHLTIGTYKENTLDMVKKDRHYWRRPLPWQKLNPTDVERIRDMRMARCTQQQIADWIGVSRPLISLVLSGAIHHAR
jgi:hypothetical protein